MSKAVKAARVRSEDGGLTQEQLEDLLAQVTRAQVKVTGHLDRLALIGEQIREVRSGRAEAGWTVPDAGAPRTERAESRP